MVTVALEAVSRVHRDGTVALDRLSLSVGDGELLVVSGPSGSGKTTTLRIVAGLERQTSGVVRIDDVVVDDVPTRDRDVALVAQEHALYPFLTARENLEFPLRVRGTAADEIQRRVAAEVRALGLIPLLGRLPSALSAGHRQRVAMGRATARRPRVFLMDEPLSALDAGERAQRRLELRRIQRGMGVTMLYATNDQTDALALADRVAVLRAGHLEQIGPPQELLARPANTFVAGLIGSPAMRFIPVRVQEDGALGYLRIGEQRLRVPGGLPGPMREVAGRELLLGIRPHQLRDARTVSEAAADARLAGTVKHVEQLGAADDVTFAIAGSTLCARLDAHSGMRPGDHLEVVADGADLPLFDTVSGAALWHGRSAL